MPWPTDPRFASYFLPGYPAALAAVMAAMRSSASPVCSFPTTGGAAAATGCHNDYSPGAPGGGFLSGLASSSTSPTASAPPHSNSTFYTPPWEPQGPLATNASAFGSPTATGGSGDGYMGAGGGGGSESQRDSAVDDRGQAAFWGVWPCVKNYEVESPQIFTRSEDVVVISDYRIASSTFSSASFHTSALLPVARKHSSSYRTKGHVASHTDLSIIHAHRSRAEETRKQHAYISCQPRVVSPSHSSLPSFPSSPPPPIPVGDFLATRRLLVYFLSLSLPLFPSHHPYLCLIDAPLQHRKAAQLCASKFSVN
ncbi:hypothetical protein TSMEX_000132 [Taenia solium]|eukprot:TsM_000785500 transcript=TsM_000785500 gene=TsM_000785500